jgi:hypothetical protein
MVTQVKKNEKVVLPLFKNGPTLQFFTLTFQSAIHEKLGATAAGVRSPVVAALDAIAQVCSIEIVGEPQNSNTEISIGIAAIGGNFGTDFWDGTNSETFAAHLEDLVQASGLATGSLQTVANTATTVVAGVATNI